MLSGRLLLLGLASTLFVACSAPTPAQRLPTPYRVRVTGHGFHWFIRHSGLDGELDTADDVLGERELRLPAATSLRLDLRSDDYVYTFALPHLDRREIAVPDLAYGLQFEVAAAGHYPIRGSQMCGYTHPSLMGELVVVSPAEFVAWLHANTP